MEKRPKRSRVEIYRILFRRFIRVRGNSTEIAKGFALGAFIGMSPTLGIQMILAVFFAALLKWNKISASIGVWISNALTVPFIYTATYIIGARFLRMKNDLSFPRHMSVEVVIDLLQKAPKMLLAMAVGGVIIGIPIALIVYFITYRISLFYQNQLKEKIKRRRERRQKDLKK